MRENRKKTYENAFRKTSDLISTSRHVYVCLNVCFAKHLHSQIKKFCKS